MTKRVSPTVIGAFVVASFAILIVALIVVEILIALFDVFWRGR